MQMSRDSVVALHEVYSPLSQTMPSPADPPKADTQRKRKSLLIPSFETVADREGKGTRSITRTGSNSKGSSTGTTPKSENSGKSVTFSDAVVVVGNIRSSGDCPRRKSALVQARTPFLEEHTPPTDPSRHRNSIQLMSILKPVSSDESEDSDDDEPTSPALGAATRDYTGPSQGTISHIGIHSLCSQLPPALHPQPSLIPHTEPPSLPAKSKEGLR